MYNSFFKSLLDRFLGLSLSIATLPLILFLLILIRFTSKGSPIFTQERVGLNGRTFKMYKLRTMIIHQASEHSYVTKDKDVRITKIGKLLRKTSLDELPQLWNLLKGEMSLVGPRPDLFIQKSLYTSENWKKRLTVRPGITGLSQSILRSTGTLEDRLKLDLEYIDNVCFKLDAKILLMTLMVVLNSRKSN